ncbi:trichohyalin-like [Drosophila ananassae]|nr:trichohyalin-like [Drosophila ananassae]
MPRISQLSQEQRRQAALNRSRASYEQNASQIRVRNSEHIANVRANNPELREKSRAWEATARATWRRSERIRNIERIRDAEGHAHRRQDPEERRREQVHDTHHATRRTDPEFRSRERIRDMEARANRREDPQERRREQVQDTAHHATRRTDLEYRIPERIRDMEAPRAYHRQDSEEHAREQERNTEEHRQRRRNPEERQREREMDANNRRATRRNPIARSQEQRMNTSQRRETRQQRRIREEQIRQMAEDRLINFRMDPQNRLDASQRQSQRNMDARAALSEDEMEQERELQRHRIRSSARDLYHRNIKEGPTEICVCCGGTWFRSQHQKKMPRISQLSQEQRRQAALNRSRASYEQNASQIRVRNSEHIANVRANNPELREKSRAWEATARATWRRSERIRNIERIRDAEGHAHRRQDPEERRREQVHDTHHATRRTDPEFRSRERIRDMEARANRREDPQERRREQDSEEHAREQERNTEEHRQRRRNPEERQREREMDANNRRATRRNPIARSQEQRMNTSQRRETRQQRRIREEQIRQMAEDRLINFRMDPQNRLDASQRQSQRNMDARAALSEDEMEQERELQRHRIRSSARDLYHRNIKEGPTEICVCCGGTWFRSQRNTRSAANHSEDYDEANDLEVDVEDEVAEQNYPLMDGVEDQSMLLLTENNSQLFLLRLLPSIKAKEQHIAKSRCILKEALNELRYMLDAVEPLAHRDFSF